jgi:Protein of unknown function (DUF4235)
MFKLLYKPVAIVAGIVAGVLSGLIFKNFWKVVGRGSDPPAPLDSERGWGGPARLSPAWRDIRAGQDGCRSWRRRVDAQGSRNLARRYARSSRQVARPSQS